MMSIPYMQDHGTARWVRQRRSGRLSSVVSAAGRWRRRREWWWMGREGSRRNDDVGGPRWAGWWVEGGVERGRDEREEVLAALAGPGFSTRGGASHGLRSWEILGNTPATRSLTCKLRAMQARPTPIPRPLASAAGRRYDASLSAVCAMRSFAFQHQLAIMRLRVVSCEGALTAGRAP